MTRLELILKSLIAPALCLLVAVSVSAKHNTKTPPPTPKAATSYDETRNPARDLQEAIALATETNKRILLEVGGDWCV